MNRINYIDNLRGLSFILMFIQHLFYFYDVSKLYKTHLSDNFFINLCGSFSRNLFIFLFGYLLYLLYKNFFDKFKFYNNKLFISIEILLHGLLISLVTYILYPSIFIRFGILHFISLATFICSLLLPYPKYYIVFLTIFLVIQPPKINTFLDTITGASINFKMMDWFPLFMWLPIMILGMICAHNNILNKLKILNYDLFKSSNLLTYIGKNSLNLYTLHVIILIYFYYFLEHKSSFNL